MIVPTRELAIQVSKVIVALGDYVGIKCHTVVGGLSVSADVRALRQGTHVIVGTPGRIYDMINRKALVTSSVHTLILDEADDCLSS